MITYSNAKQYDIPACARLYRIAFPEALTVLFGRPDISLSAIEDIFNFFYQYESDGFCIASQNREIIGYVISVSNLRGVICKFIWQGYPFRLFLRWGFNKYENLSLGFIPRLFYLWRDYRNKVTFQYSKSTSQILSIVVSLEYQGQGVGTQLLEKALEYQKSRSVSIVRLEVEEKNISAIHVYKKLGFVEQGKFQTPLGPALIMIKLLQ